MLELLQVEKFPREVLGPVVQRRWFGGWWKRTGGSEGWGLHEDGEGRGIKSAIRDGKRDWMSVRCLGGSWRIGVNAMTYQCLLELVRSEIERDDTHE